jgi:hypothetical protein
MFSIDEVALVHPFCRPSCQLILYRSAVQEMLADFSSLHDVLDSVWTFYPSYPCRLAVLAFPLLYSDSFILKEYCNLGCTRFFFSHCSLKFASKSDHTYSAIVLPHLITLSARTNTFGGIVRPICLAAFNRPYEDNGGILIRPKRSCLF